MAKGGDRAVGLALLLFSIFVFVYYTCWVIVSPFVEPGHFFHSFFPDRYWAIVIPVVLMILGVTLIGTFLALVMIRKGKPKKA